MTAIVIVLVVVIFVLLVLVGFGTMTSVRGRIGHRRPLGGPPVSPPRPSPPKPTAPPQPEAPPSVREALAELEHLTELEEIEQLEAIDGTPAVEPALEVAPALELPTHLPEALPEAKRPRIRERVGRARELFGAPLAAIRRRGAADEATFEELEEALLLADAGLPTTERLLGAVREQIRRGELQPDAEALLDAVKAEAVALFGDEDRSLHVADSVGTTTVWLFVGVNGVGKTTTIGKLANFEQAAGRSVVLAAGDTFRAAAAEQLELWGERAGVPVVRGAEGADPSSVVFDAIQHATARGAEIVIADTAGRLHTKVNLMEELRKVRRIADRPPGAVTEVLLVLDATTGQNGLAQARQFSEAVGVTGIVLTKLDGTAKGGIVLAVRSELGVPIKLVGLGEQAEDLVEFDPEEFVGALFESP